MLYRRLAMEVARKLLFVVDRSEMAAERAVGLCGRLADFVKDRGISAALVLRSGYVLLVSTSAIRLNGGCATLRSVLELTSDATRVTSYRDLPSDSTRPVCGRSRADRCVVLARRAVRQREHVEDLEGGRRADDARGRERAYIGERP